MANHHKSEATDFTEGELYPQDDAVEGNSVELRKFTVSFSEGLPWDEESGAPRPFGMSASADEYASRFSRDVSIKRQDRRSFKESPKNAPPKKKVHHWLDSMTKVFFLQLLPGYVVTAGHMYFQKIYCIEAYKGIPGGKDICYNSIAECLNAAIFTGFVVVGYLTRQELLAKGDALNQI